MVKSFPATQKKIRLESVKTNLENHHYYYRCVNGSAGGGAEGNTSGAEWICLLFATAGRKHSPSAHTGALAVIYAG